MKVRTPDYYKDFRCIDKQCTDTCCAGWDVDVDEQSYKYYKKVKGPFGKRLKSVMVPSKEGGCTFTLKDGRCPFLNEENLCDLYIELGEDKLCETCAEFPRFINTYGGLKEIGIAPSCKTAGELIFNAKEKLTFDLVENDEPITCYNEIDPELYFNLIDARKIAFQLVQDRTRTINERCILLLEFAVRIQNRINQGRIDLIKNTLKSFKDGDYCTKILSKHANTYCQGQSFYELSEEYLKLTRQMEVINPDWYKYLKIHHQFIEICKEHGGKECFIQQHRMFDEYYANRQFEYEQLLMYYVYRYFLDAVNDDNVLLKMKNGIVGYIVLKELDIAAWYKNGKILTKTEQIDIAHLYSRQFEHSYVNFILYSEAFEKKRCYSIVKLMQILHS
jgi:lysine-N-methylase